MHFITKPNRDELWYGALTTWEGEPSLQTYNGSPVVGRYDEWQTEKWAASQDLVIVGFGEQPSCTLTLRGWYEAQGAPVPEGLQ